VITPDIARKSLSEAERLHAVAVSKLDASRADLTAAEGEHDTKQTKVSREAVLAAKADVESAERVLNRRTEAVAKSREVLADAERAEMARLFDEERATLSRFDADVAPIVDQILALDRQLDDLVLTIAGQVSEARALHALAASHATSLGLTLESPVPTIADLRLRCQRVVRDARLAEERDDLSQWIESASADWRVANMTAAELAQNEAFAARQADEQRVRERARQLARQLVEHVLLAPDTPPATSTTTT
jgi:hypothetical protein